MRSAELEKVTPITWICPDVFATFDVTDIADKKYLQLLSNGNQVDMRVKHQMVDVIL
ncbi:hypothetical protein P4S63_24740 [Pseudoalteromonas sp. B193]